MSRWEAAAALCHPHLVRLFDVGRWQSGGQEFAFVVMEHADQTLAGILRHRPLDAEEARELLIPSLEVLTFLHRRNLAHSQLKPSNYLAVGDQLKLASDTVRPVDLGCSTADDIRGLGITLVEALTRRAPQPSAADSPADLPAPFADIVRRCLSANPSDRPTAAKLRAQYKPAPQTTAINGPVDPGPSDSGPRAVAIPEAAKPATQAITNPAAPKPAPQATTIPKAPKPAPHAGAIPKAPESAQQAVATPEAPKSAPRAVAISEAAKSAPQAVAITEPSQAAPRVVAKSEPSHPARQAVTATDPFDPTAGSHKSTAAQRSASEVTREVTSQPGILEQLLALPRRPAAAAGVLAGALLLLLAVWIGLRDPSASQADLKPAVDPDPTPAALSDADTDTDTDAALAADSQVEQPIIEESTEPSLPPAVVHQVVPEAPQQALERIRGRIFVMIRVLVDSEGNVIAALMEEPGPNPLFARLADDAARQWRFVPSENRRPRVWIVKFTFTSEGVTARVIEQ